MKENLIAGLSAAIAAMLFNRTSRREFIEDLKNLCMKIKPRRKQELQHRENNARDKKGKRQIIEKIDIISLTGASMLGLGMTAAFLLILWLINQNLIPDAYINDNTTVSSMVIACSIGSVIGAGINLFKAWRYISLNY